MRKIINISALIFFVWLVLDTFQIPAALLNFLIIGELPGTQKSLSPTMMLAILTTIVSIIFFELLARKFAVIRQTRQQFLSLINKRERLPRRRFSRINPAN